MKKSLATILATAMALVTISGTMVYGEEVEFAGETYDVIGELTDDQDYNDLQESYEERGIESSDELDEDELEYYNSALEAGTEASTTRLVAEGEQEIYEAASAQYETDNAAYQKEVEEQAAQIAAYEQSLKDYETAKEAYDEKVANIDNLTEDDVQGYSFDVSKSEKWNNGKDKVAEIKLDDDGEYYVRLEGKNEWVKADKVLKKNKINDMKKSYMKLAKQEIINNAPVKPDELNLPTLTPPEAPKDDTVKAAYEVAEKAYTNYLEKLHAYVEWLNNKTTPEPPVSPDEVEEAREEYVEANNAYVAQYKTVYSILKDAQKKVPKYIYNDEIKAILKEYYNYCADGHDAAATNEYVVLCCMMNDIETACFIHGVSCNVNGINNNLRGAFAINSYVEFISNYNPTATLEVQLMNLHAFYKKLI